MKEIIIRKIKSKRYGFVTAKLEIGGDEITGISFGASYAGGPYDHMVSFIEGYCYAFGVNHKEHVQIIEEYKDGEIISKKLWKEVWS